MTRACGRLDWDRLQFGHFEFSSGALPVISPVNIDLDGMSFPERVFSEQSVFPANRDFLMSFRRRPILGRLLTGNHSGVLSVGAIAITALWDEAWRQSIIEDDDRIYVPYIYVRNI